MTQPGTAEQAVTVTDTTTGKLLMKATTLVLLAQAKQWQIPETALKGDVDRLKHVLMHYGVANNKLTDAPDLPTTVTRPTEPATRDDLATLTRIVQQLSTNVDNLKTGLVAQVLPKVLEAVHVDLDAKLSPVTADVAGLQKSLDETNATCAVLQQKLGRLEAKCSVLDKVAVQVDDAAKKERSCRARLTNFAAVPDEDLRDRVQKELVQGKLELGSTVTVVSAVRQEVKKRSYADAVGSSKAPERDVPAPVLIEFATAGDRLAVLRARRNLQGTKWGLEEDLTPLQQSKKRAAWSAFQDAKTAGKRAYWRAEKLFINGVEYLP